MRVDFLLTPAVPQETAWAQADYARGLGLRKPMPRGGSLAVVGGGQSVHAYVETLRRFKSDVWAVNGAYGWCIDRGIDATFYSADPQACVVDYARDAARAILPPWCHPDIWNIEAEIEMVDFYPTFSASAPNVAVCAFDLGYSDITFFGCDCSFADQTHTYEHKMEAETMLVRAAGLMFRTTPAYFVQAEEISTLCREFPGLIREMCGGLTHALTLDPDYDVEWMSPAVESLFDNAITFDALTIG